MPEHDSGERTLEALDAALAGRPVPPDLTELAELVRDCLLYTSPSPRDS